MDSLVESDAACNFCSISDVPVYDEGADVSGGDEAGLGPMSEPSTLDAEELGEEEGMNSASGSGLSSTIGSPCVPAHGTSLLCRLDDDLSSSIVPSSPKSKFSRTCLL